MSDDQGTLVKIRGLLYTGTQETTHACPPDGSSLTLCCDRSVFDLPSTDRLTLDPSLVTCKGGSSSDSVSTLR